MIGTVLGGYQLSQKLGEGATGETYLAVHQESGHKAAVKLLFPPFSSDAELLGRYLAEVRAASQVNHVGIADLYDSGVHTDGRAFLAMEFLEGKTLTDSLMELGSVTDMGSLADIGWQLATLLGACHAAKLVHGALKPDAIFLTFPASQAPRPLVKLVDFGMAKFSLSVRHSQTGSLLGAPLYMAPEIARGLGSADHRADIYALGCILFELACGRPPFVREGKGELIIAHATELPPPVSSLEPTIPQPLDSLIGKMLTKNPGTRPQAMAEVASVLERFFDCPSPAATFAQPTPSLPSPAATPPAAVAGPSLAPPPANSPVATPVAPFAPTPVAPIQTAIAPPSPGRRPDPTALLPPSAEGVPASIRPTSNQTWLSRVQQRTVLLPATGNPVPSAASPHRYRDRPSGPSSTQRRGKPSASPAQKPSLRAYVSIPVVVATASAVLVVGSTLLILRARKRPPAPPPKPAVSATAPRPEPATPPPRPLLAAPATTPVPLPAPPQPMTVPRRSDPSELRAARRATPVAPAQPEPGRRAKPW